MNNFNLWISDKKPIQFQMFSLFSKWIVHLTIIITIALFKSHISLGNEYCGEIYTIDSSNPYEDIKSPGFPDAYPPNITCLWRVKTTFGNRIRILFQKFNLRKSKVAETCNNVDSLEISELQFQRRYCGSKLPLRGKLLSIGPIVDITLQSEFGNQPGSFHLRISAESIRCRNRYDNDDRMAFSSPSAAPDSVEAFCVWTLEVREGSLIKLTCTDFDLSSSEGCQNEALVVYYNADEDLRESEKFCKQKPVSTLLLEGNKASLLYYSRKNESNRGIKCHYGPYSEDVSFQRSGIEGCGRYQQVLRDFRIVGGKQAETHVPLIGLYNSVIECGGVLVTPEYVLTAAHCIRPSELQDLNIFIMAPKKSARKFIRVKRAIIHERYRHDGLLNDIALIQIFRDPSITSEHVACLAPPGFLVERRRLHVFGWGLTYRDDYSPFKNILHGLTIPVGNFETCKDYYWKKHKKQLTSRVFCAGREGQDSCAGDSGGPALLIYEDRLTVAGIVTFGENNLCGDFLGVYTKVSSYTNWILKHLDD